MKIITHDGTFHADEVFAIALLHQVYGECPVERRRNILQDEFENSKIWILDVGMKWEPKNHNFDHHHDALLHSTNMLVISYLNTEKIITQLQTDELMKEFETISNIDCNGYKEFNGFQVNSLIKSFNYLDNGFQIALDTAKAFVRAKFDTVDKATQSDRIWALGKTLFEHVRQCQGFPLHWKRYKIHPFLLHPDGKQWKLHSIDSTRYPLKEIGCETFFHKAKFLAIYDSHEQALRAAYFNARLLPLNFKMPQTDYAQV